MERCSALQAICEGNSPVTGEFPLERPAARSFDVFFDLRLNKRLSKQSWGWWFETPSRSLWRHCNGTGSFSMWRRHRGSSVSNLRNNTACLACFVTATIVLIVVHSAYVHVFSYHTFICCIYSSWYYINIVLVIVVHYNNLCSKYRDKGMDR